MTRIVGETAPVTSRLAGSSDARFETTAMDAVGGRPIEARSRPTVESGVIGPYFSAAAVPCPTRTTSASPRRVWKILRSPAEPSPPLRPSTVTEPSREVTKLTRRCRPAGTR